MTDYYHNSSILVKVIMEREREREREIEIKPTDNIDVIMDCDLTVIGPDMSPNMPPDIGPHMPPDIVPDILVVGGGRHVPSEYWERTHPVKQNIRQNATTLDIDSIVNPHYCLDFNDFTPPHNHKYKYIYFHYSTFHHVVRNDDKFFNALNRCLSLGGKLIFTYASAGSCDMVRGPIVPKIEYSLGGYVAKYSYNDYANMNTLIRESHKKYIMDKFIGHSYKINYVESTKYPLYEESSHNTYKYFIITHC